MRAGMWLGALAVVGATACVPVVATAGPTCALGWGAQDQTSEPMAGSPIVDVRAGVHDCYDRLVVDMVGTVVPGYAVRYVDTVRQIASDEPIPLRGGAFLEVVVRAPAIDVDTGASTFPRRAVRARRRRRVPDVPPGRLGGRPGGAHRARPRGPRSAAVPRLHVARPG